jgi:hypothetical protein
MTRLTLIFLSIVALSSCSRTDVSFRDSSDEILVRPVSSNVTKGAVEGTTYDGSGFNANAYFANEPAGSSFTEASAYFEDAPFISKGDGLWGAATPRYWPKNGSLRFAAWSPGIGGVSYSLATDTYSVTGFTQSADLSRTVDLMFAPATVSHTAETSLGGIDVVFEHSLAWVTVQVQALSSDDEGLVRVTGLKMNGVDLRGDLTAVMSGASKSMTWTSSGPGDVEVFSGSVDLVHSQAAVLENAQTPRSLLVIPQGGEQKGLPTIDLTIAQKAGEGEIVQTIRDLSLTRSEKAPKRWEAGKHYIYTVRIGLDEILISPTVQPWTPVDVPTVVE